MGIPTFDYEIFDPIRFSTVSADSLAGVLLISIPRGQDADTGFSLYARSANEILTRLKSVDGDLEHSLIAQEQKMLAARRTASGVDFLGMMGGSITQGLRQPAYDTDIYTPDTSDGVNSSELSEIAYYYFVLYNLQERFKAPGKVTFTALDIPEKEVAEHMKSFYSRLLQTAHCLEDYGLAAESLRAFIPEKNFGFCAAELVSLSLQPVSKDREERADMLCQIPQSIMQQNYELAAVQRDACFPAKLGY